MAIDTSRTLEIKGSPWKALKMVGASAMMAALSAAVAFHYLPNVRPGSLVEFVGYAGVLFFGLGTLLLIWQYFRLRGPVLTLTPDGIRDSRLSAQAIPWKAVSSVSAWDISMAAGKSAAAAVPAPLPVHGTRAVANSRTVVLAVDADTENRIVRTRLAKWMRNANRGFGADGLAISPLGLAIGFDELLDTCRAYWQAAQQDR